MYTTHLHGFAVKALGPAIDLVHSYANPTYRVMRFGFFEVLGANILLYTFWIFAILTLFDLLLVLKRTLGGSK